MKKLLEVQNQLITFKKDGTNPHFKSKYLTLDNLLEKLLPICNDLWLLIVHSMKDNMVTTTVISDKEEMSSSFPITDFTNPQKIWSAITYAKRYNLGMIFNVVTDDDDDGNKASDNHKPLIERKEFTEANYTKFTEEYKKHIGKYPTAESMIKMLDTQYVVSEHYKTRITEFYKSL